VYGLEIGIVGTKGVIDIEDTHRDLVLASNVVQGGGYTSDGYNPPARHVDFLTSYPPGDLHMGQLWGPMREETVSWYASAWASPRPTPRRRTVIGTLILTMAMDLSARRKTEIELPASLDDLMAAD
jgi:myo-inositol 2-dehydrogenase / D-chiro-inositol 1-dehydrogenase